MLGRRKHLAVASVSCSVILLMVVMSGYTNSGSLLPEQRQDSRSEGTVKIVTPSSQSLALTKITQKTKENILKKPQALAQSTKNIPSKSSIINTSSPQFRKSAVVSNTNSKVVTNNSSFSKGNKVIANHQNIKPLKSNKFEMSKDPAKKFVVNSNKGTPETKGILKSPKTISSSSKKITNPNAMMNIRFYPQLMKAAVSGARHRVALEYDKFPVKINFKPGFTVPKTATKRILILTTWRSGSTFLGDIFNAYPGTFYSFEPLHMMLQKKHFQDGPEKESVLRTLKGVMNCNMTDRADFFEYAKEKDFLFTHNSRYWQSCSVNRALCFDPTFYNQICEVMPVNVLKTVRMGVQPVADLMADPALDLKVIHLVRDPRGTMQSRKKLAWCKAEVCSNPKVVCNSLAEDLAQADHLQNKYPDRYLLVRYEDLSTRPHEMVNMLLDFVDLTYTDQMKRFVSEHTNIVPSKKTPFKRTNAIMAKKNRKKYSYAYSTFRDSKSTVFKWRNSLKYSDMKAVQNVCTAALNVLNFRLFHSEDEYKNEELSVFLPDD